MPRLLVSAAGAAVLFACVYVFRSEIGALLSRLKNFSISDTADIIRSWGAWGPLLSIALMLLQSVAAPIPSFAVTAANGLVFGPLWGSALSWLGAMAGAAAAFYIGRLFQSKTTDPLLKKRDVRGYVERISGKFGFRTILVARLLPFISFDVISYAAGLSYMRSAAFFAATGIGMIPGTLLYASAGAGLTSLDACPGMLLLIFILAVAGIAVSSLLKRARRNKKQD